MKQSKKDRFLQLNDSGQGLSEYLILALLIVVGSIAASRTLGTTIQTKLGNINEQLQNIHVP
jgi:Flp pilus assembly pilin Flp